MGEELTYEREASSEGVPDFIKEFTSQGVWSINDSAGADEVSLVRQFGTETVRLMFSIADLVSVDQARVRPVFHADFNTKVGEAEEVI